MSEMKGKERNLGDDAGSDETESLGAAPKKKRKKWPIAIGVMAVIVIAAGAGFMMWHEQPSFCNAICHSPMDPYVDNYYSEDSTALAAVHREADTVCLDCHEPVLSEQISEGMKWLSGDFITNADTGMLVIDPEKQAGLVPSVTCKSCHNMDEAKAATEDFEGNQGANPHDSHVGELECSSCHSSHGASTLYCGNCHSFTLPEGWEYPTKA